jgi:hypothetical protein
VRGRIKHVLPPPHKIKLYRKVDLLLQSTQLIGMNVSIEHMALRYSFIFPNLVPKGAFTFNSHDCLTYIKQHMTSVHIKD